MIAGPPSFVQFYGGWQPACKPSMPKPITWLRQEQSKAPAAIVTVGRPGATEQGLPDHRMESKFRHCLVNSGKCPGMSFTWL